MGEKGIKKILRETKTDKGIQKQTTNRYVKELYEHSAG